MEYGTNIYLDKFKQFKFQSFLPRVEIIDALIKVRGRRSISSIITNNN
jgi:hypothetical protein